MAFAEFGGQAVQQRWVDAAVAVAFEHLEPVSAFPVVPGRRWGPGLWWSATTGRHVASGSNAMRAQLMVLDRDPDIIGLAGRPVRLLWRDEPRRVRSWTPQLFARRADGTALLADCPSHTGGGGKTTALLQVGRTCHLAHTQTAPPPGKPSDVQVPVAYVLVPPGATAKTLAAEFARYLGIPVTARMTQAQITESVCHTYNQAGVRLVLIDEIHRVNPRTTTGAETADFIKDLTERITATFVYAGTSRRRPCSPVSAVPSWPAGRHSSSAGPSPHASATGTPSLTPSPTSKTPSTSTTTGPGTLPRHATYLHHHTTGRIGSLTRPIRQAAITAIYDGTERITKQTLDAIRLDHHAETTHQPRTHTPTHRTPR